MENVEAKNIEAVESGPSEEYVAEDARAETVADTPHENNAEEIAVLQHQIDATLEAARPSPQENAEDMGREHETASASGSAPDMETTFLDRHPTLAKWARSVMLVAGLGTAGSALAKDDITVHQQVGGGQAVAVQSGTVKYSGTQFGEGAEKQTAHKGGSSANSETKTVQKKGTQTVTVGGRVVSSGDNLGGVTLKGNTVIIDGKAIPLDGGGRIEVNQKADKIEGSLTGATIK